MMSEKILEKPKVRESPFTVYDPDNVQWFDMCEEDENIADPDAFQPDLTGYRVTPQENLFSDTLIQLWEGKTLSVDYLPSWAQFSQHSSPWTATAKIDPHTKWSKAKYLQHS